MKRILLILLVGLFIVGCQGLNTLIRYSKETDAQQKEMAIQQRNFEKVKLAIEENKLTKQSTAREIKRRYGEPVLIMDEGNLKRWVYKTSEVGLGAEKVCLYFEEDKLIQWEYIPEEKL